VPDPPTKNHPLKIILDSNALFIPLELKIDIFEALKTLLNRNTTPILLSPIKHELELLTTKGPPKLRRQAAFALHLAQHCHLVTVEDHDKTVDDIILQVAKNWNAPVFTNDRLLRRRLRDISVPVIYLRQKARLDIDGLVS
jgi:rRNA-processing protein FCF1